MTTVRKCCGKYTGLKDREGREIYVGDILEFDSIAGKIVHGYVTYCDENARYEVIYQRGKYKRPLPFICALKEPIIIGNTCENPELLNGERLNA